MDPKISPKVLGGTPPTVSGGSGAKPPRKIWQFTTANNKKRYKCVQNLYRRERYYANFRLRRSVWMINMITLLLCYFIRGCSFGDTILTVYCLTVEKINDYITNFKI